MAPPEEFVDELVQRRRQLQGDLAQGQGDAVAVADDVFNAQPGDSGQRLGEQQQEQAGDAVGQVDLVVVEQAADQLSAYSCWCTAKTDERTHRAVRHSAGAIR